MSAAESWVGRAVLRKEDERLVTGRGTFLDDVEVAGLLEAAMLRSPHAHARILSVDVSGALALPGVMAVVTGADALRLTNPIRPLIPTPTLVRDFCLATDRVRFVGEPLAAVAAVDRASAEDALESIRVEYAPLPPVIDPLVAMTQGAPVLYDELGTNVLWHDTLVYGDVAAAFAAADGVLRERFEMQRYASTPLETFGCIAEYDRADAYDFWTNDQRPGLTLGVLAESLRVPESRLRLRCPDIGGGFGNKRRPAYLLVCALLARVSGRPVKYVEDRIENLTALMHACGGTIDLELAYRADGTLLGLRVTDIADEGKNLISPAQHNLIKLGNMTNGYRIPAVEYAAYSVLTNKCPTGANRGIGKPFMCFAMERAMALLARRLALDPVELRQRNYVQPEEMPYTTPSGGQYDSGDYPATLRRALSVFDYARWRTEQQLALRSDGPLLGIGIATSVEPAGTNPASYELVTGRRTASGSAEAALVRVEPDGSVRAALGDPPSGQGYETVIAQIVADELGLTPHDVDVARGFDSTTTPWMYLSGNYSNKFSVTDVGAVLGAARRVRDKILRLAAHRLEVAAADLELRDGGVQLRGAPGQRVSLREVARVAYQDMLALPPGEDPGLESRYFHQNPLSTSVDAEHRVRGQLVYANAAHCCVVAIDRETGQVRLVKYVVVHDCGKELNPGIVEGMVHGATAHGIGAALLEAFRYDADGQLLTASFMDYLKPTTLDIPDIEVDRLEHPSPFTPLGAKGVGEGGAIPGPACVANAVEDALGHLGCTVRGLPITPDQVWQWLQQRQGIS